MEDATLVLLTPVALTPSTWDGAVGMELAQYRYAYPGHGDRPPQDEWSLTDLADDIVTRVAGPLHLIGVSMGSMVAQHVAVHHPERVASMVLMAGGATVPRDIILARAHEVAERGVAPTVTGTLARWFSADRLQEPADPTVARISALLQAAHAPSVAQAWRAIADHELRDRLGEVSAPVTVLAAEADKATSVATMAELADLLPNAHLEIVPGPHMLHLESPAVFSGLVAEHFHRLE